MASTNEELVDAVIDYAGRDASAHNKAALKRNRELLLARLEGADTPDKGVDAPVSADPKEALPQLLEAVGVEPGPSGSYDPAAVVKAATPDQNRQLALLGFFGQPGNPGTPGVDWSLFKRYYIESEVGLTPDGQPTEGNWAPRDETVATDGPWQMWSRGD